MPAPLSLRSLPLLFAAVALGALTATDAANNSTPTSKSKGPVAYRWVDEQGVVHYGDNVPPQYATQQRTELNAQGVEVGRLEAQKSPEQVAADEHAHAAELKQKQHDAFLVSTYTSVKDIEALRDVRLDQLKSQREAAAQYVESLRVRLASLQARALNCAPYNANGRPMSDDLAENLVRTVNEMQQQNSALSASSTEEAKLRSEFQADIDRYRELHTIHTPQ
jgi:Domain of unknown function (DUF4124)